LTVSFTGHFGTSNTPCEIDYSQYRGITGIGATALNIITPPNGAAWSDTLQITTTTQAAIIVEGVHYVSDIGSACTSLGYASSQNNIQLLPCQQPGNGSFNGLVGESQSNSVGTHAYSVTGSATTCTGGNCSLSHFGIELKEPSTAIPSQLQQCY